MTSFMLPTDSSVMRSRRESAAILQKKLAIRPSQSQLEQERILVSKMADRARALERKKNQESLTSRLLQRPERWELHSAGVMEPEVPTNSQEPECQTVRARIREKRQRQEQSDGRKPDFNTKIDNKGTMSRSQMVQELEAAELARQRELTIRR